MFNCLIKMMLLHYIGELVAPQLSPHLTNCLFYVRDPSALDQNAMSNICIGSVTFREVHLRLKARTSRRSTPRVMTREKIQQQLWQLLGCHGAWQRAVGGVQVLRVDVN